MNVNAISSAYNSTQVSSISPISSVSSLLDTYHEEVVTGSSSFGYSQDSVDISSEGHIHLSKVAPPNFDSMTIDDFKSHLEEMQSTLAYNGYESTFDISSLSDDELSALKDDMASRGPSGNNPPPPPPSSSASSSLSYSDTKSESNQVENTVSSIFQAETTASSDTEDLYDMLMEALAETEQTNTDYMYESVNQMLGLYANLS